MIHLPSELKPFEEEAVNFLSTCKRGEVHFSYRTYQLQFIEDKSEIWVFLQFDKQKRLKDFFCSCENGYQEPVCKHITAGFLSLFDGYKVPIHVRFEKSIWNIICRLYFDKFGDDSNIVVKKGEKTYIVKDKFQIVAKTKKGLDLIDDTFFYRVEETEETSIKFSNLSDEEIKLYRQGRPSLDLKYELSFWSDLAKILFFKVQKGQTYKISYKYFEDNIPNQILIELDDFSLSFKLDFEEFAEIIPTLNDVVSPLIVHSFAEDSIEKVVYDPERKELIFKENSDFEKARGIEIGKFIFVQGIGFYAKEKHHLLKRRIEGKDINNTLNEYLQLIKNKLVNVKIHDEIREVKQKIFFDDSWNFHIKLYLFDPGDLEKPNNCLFNNWVYIDLAGFYPIENNVFNQVETIIEERDIEDFIREYRVILNEHVGFKTHISGLEAKVSYLVTDTGELILSKKYFLTGLEKKIKDFGSWIYIQDQGFYSKTASEIDLKFYLDNPIGKEKIPTFLHMHKEALELIPNFFSLNCPVDKAGVDIAVDRDGNILVSPKYTLFDQYKERNVLFFDDYTFVDGEGFFELPRRKRLPERYVDPIKIEKKNLSYFLAYELDTLRSRALTIDKRLCAPKKIKVICDTLTRTLDVYHLNIKYQSEFGAVSLTNIRQAIENRLRFFVTDAGLIDLDDDSFNWIKKIDRTQINLKTNTLKLTTIELLKLNAMGYFEVIAGKEILDELVEFKSATKPNTELLKSSLWPYQQKGVEWLWFLYLHGLSGLLCDDMGLGKTHQAMGLIAASISHEKENLKFLIVCPTSVLYHWQDKFSEFMPSVKVMLYHGLKRNLADFAKYDVLLTSYGTLRKDSEKIKDISFRCAIFDEIQAAKNQTSRIHASLLNINSYIRLGLTGTPIENRLRELKAIFDIILPSYMPGATEFKDFFIIPIEKENDKNRRKLLSNYILPFLLKRKKEEVLPDLPEKIEEIAHIELSEEQQIMYNELIFRQKEGIISDLQNRKKPISYIHIFSLLSALKQVCNHPACFLKCPENFREYKSGKWELFVELILEAIESGQKVVVFSQYLAMLDIIEKFLKEEKIGFASIRGATKKRGEQIKRFNQDPKCKVFVGSLQAAGLGIDLTGGSVVIHYDRWWNKAREDQATDRVHRIGQSKGVQVFKMVTINTFEERIDKMIQRKGKLMEEIITVDDHRFMKKFGRSELMELFKELN